MQMRSPNASPFPFIHLNSNLRLFDLQIVDAVQLFGGGDLFQPGRFFDGFGAGDGAGPMLERDACVAQIRILEGDDFVAQRGHHSGGGAVLAHFQIESLVNMDNKVFERRRQVFGQEEVDLVTEKSRGGEEVQS